MEIEFLMLEKYGQYEKEENLVSVGDLYMNVQFFRKIIKNEMDDLSINGYIFQLRSLKPGIFCV